MKLALAHTEPEAQSDQFFIFCVGQHDLQIDSFKRWAAANNVSIKPVIGSYKGQRERSFIAAYKDYRIIAPFLIQEETILLIEDYDLFGNPKAYLVNVNGGEKQDLGRLVPVSQQYAYTCENWTYNPQTDKYYTTDR